jgi:hypothetical protein
MRHVTSGLAAVAVAATASIVMAGVPAAGAAESQGADEYRVKAAIVYNLAKFVEWPAESFTGPTDPLNVCVLGVDPFGPALDDAFRGHLVGGRTVTVRRTADVEPGCHLLFISRSEQKRTTVIADRVRASSVLTISEQEGFGAAGGMIELFTEGDRVRFNLNVVALEAAHLRASARLREIASNEKHVPGGRR